MSSNLIETSKDVGGPSRKVLIFDGQGITPLPRLKNSRNTVKYRSWLLL